MNRNVNRKILFLATSVTLAFVCSTTENHSMADNNQAAIDQVVEDPNQTRVNEAIERLDSPKFTDRVVGQRQLEALGLGAIKPLESVVLNGESEAAERALNILKKYFESESPTLAKPSEESLQRIAATKGHAKAGAAHKILHPLSDDRSNSQPRLGFQQAPGQFMQNRIAVKMKNINGKRSISVDDNGTKWRFEDLANGGLKVSRPDGKGGQKVTQYKSEQELEKADPDAFQLFKRYVRQNGVQIQIGGGFGQMNQIQKRMQLPGLGPQFAPPGIQIRPRQLQPIQPVPKKPKAPKSGNLIEV